MTPLLVCCSSRFLKDKTKSVDIAKDGAACKYYLKRNSYDIVFVDLKLPDCSGYELIPLIKKVNPNCRNLRSNLLLLIRLIIDKALNLGADAYITKPISQGKIDFFFREN